MLKSIMFSPLVLCTDKRDHVIAESSEIDGHAVSWILHLAPFLCLSTKLPDKFHGLGDTGRAYRMTFGFKSSGGVDRKSPINFGFPLANSQETRSSLKESNFLTDSQFQDGEGIMEFRKGDILWPHACHLVGLFRGQPDCIEAQRILAVMHAMGVRGTGDSRDTDRLLPEILHLGRIHVHQQYCC